MPTIGTLPVTTFRTQPDQTDYALVGHTVSSTHKVALRRQLPVVKGEDRGVLRANAQIVKSFAVGELTKDVVFNLSGVIPVGVDTTALGTWMDDVVELIATSAEFKALMISGDINVSD